MRGVAPVRLVELYSMPSFNSFPDQLSQRHPLALGADIPQQPPRDKYSHKPMHIRMLRKQRPIEPVGFSVLAISVVVAKLRAPNLIPHQQHGQTKREQRNGQEVFNLTISESL